MSAANLITDIAMAWRFARRELRAGLRGFRIFLACLTLGIAAIAAIGSLRMAIEQGLAQQAQELLGGDAEVEFTFRFASAEERAWLESKAVKITELADFRSMLVVGQGDDTDRALTLVKAVDGAYPLVGRVDLSPDISLHDALATKDGRHGGVVEKLLAERLGIQIGDVFRIGQSVFELRAYLQSTPDSTSGFAMAPKTIVYRSALSESGLLAQGSFFDGEYRMVLPAGTDLDLLKAQVSARFADQGVQWRDKRAPAPRINNFVQRFSSFLTLVGLAGLAVGGVGVASAIRSYLAGKTQSIAILRSLGAKRQLIFWTYFLQIAVMAILGVVLGICLGVAIPLLFAPLISAALPVPTVFGVYLAPVVEAGLYGVLIALLFTIWPLAAVERIRAAHLLRAASGGAGVFPKWPVLLGVAVLLTAFLMVAIAYNGAPAITLWSAFGVVLALGILSMAAWAIASGASAARGFVQGRPVLLWAIGALAGATARKGEETRPVILALGLGLSVLAVIGQIDGNLRRAIDRDLPDIVPSFFFFDIQKDQIEPFLTRAGQDPRVARVDHAPILRGILSQINGEDARKVAGNHWVLRGDRGVTYSANPPENTRVVEGDFWPPDYRGPPQLSFAAEEAKELGLRLGDKITINVLGRDIETTLTNYRLVDFSDAQLGFVMMLNPAALAGAPHSFVATVYADPAIEGRVMRDIARDFPNVTAIPVRELLQRYGSLLDGIASGVIYAASLTLLTGFLVLIGAAAANERARIYEAALLKTLGATRAQILQSFALRAALSGVAAACVALAFGILGGWAVMTFVMDSGYEIIWPSALWVIFAGLLFTLVANLAFVWRPLAARPAKILRLHE